MKKKLKSLWRTFLIDSEAKRLGLDIYHGLSHELPIGAGNTKTRWILTVHDLIIYRFPHYFSRIDGLIYRWKLKYACKKADKIIAISEQTKKDLIHYLGIDENKVTIIYQDCDAAFKVPATESLRKKVSGEYNLPGRYLLQVGTIESRKNLMLSIRALSKLPSDVSLVVVGKATNYLQQAKEEITKLSLNERVVFLHSVPFGHLPAIYQMAAIFLYPSRFEGFGIPVLEALNCGVPVVAATGSCLEEAGGPESIYVNPDDELEMVSCIETILNSPQKREVMIKSGKEYAARFSDKQVASELMQLFVSLLKEQ